MYRCGSNKSPATRKEAAPTNERRKKSILKGEERKKQNPPKTILHKFNFRLKCLTTRQ